METKIWTVYYSKKEELEFEYTFHFRNLEDAVKCKEEALKYGYAAYCVEETVYENYKPWMTKYLAQ